MTVVLLILVLAGAAAAWAVTVRVQDHATKTKMVWAIVACVLLVCVSFILSLCGLSENRSMLYHERCEEGTIQLLPLVGIPILLGLAWVTGPMRSWWPWILGALIFLAAIIVPWHELMR